MIAKLDIMGNTLPLKITEICGSTNVLDNWVVYHLDG
jgi:hypothetical protein